jgi:oligosaccharide repeat unit polymerase
MKRLSKTFLYTYIFFLSGAYLFAYYNNLDYPSFEFLFFFTIIIFGIVMGEFIGEIVYHHHFPLLRIKKYELRIKSILNLKMVLKLIFIIGIIYILVYVKLNSNSTNLLIIPQEIALNRYTIGLIIPWYLKIIKVIIYSGMLISAILLGFGINIKEIYYSPFIILLEGLLSAGKSGFLFGLVLFLAFYFSTKAIRGEKFKLKIFKTLKYASYLSVFLFFAQVGRLKVLSSEIYFGVVNRLLSYAFSPILAFNQWFNQWFNQSFNQELSYGKFTFAGLADLFNISTRDDGVFQNKAYLSNEIFTNVYTAFRSLIMDFGIFGSFFFCIIIASLFGYLRLAIERGKLFGAIFILSLILSFFLWSFFGSLFAYNTYFFSSILSYYLWTISVKIK